MLFSWVASKRLHLFRSILLPFSLAFALLGGLLTGGQPVYAATNWYVDQTLGTDTAGCGTASGAAACKTITYTIGLSAAGDTINIASGTYVENVIVNKTLTILGAGQGSTIVEPAVSDPNCGGAGGGTLCTANNTVFLVQASNVTIQALTVEGANPALAASGITVGGVSINARNGIVTDYNTGTFNNLTVNQVTVNDVYLRGIYGTGVVNVSGMLFENDTVSNVQGDASGNSVGIIIRQGGGQILNNQVSNGPNGTAIDLNFSTGSTVSGNTISNSGQPIGVANTNVGVTDSVSKNIVTNSSAGIDAFAAYGTVDVDGNTLTNNTLGIVVEGQNDPSERANITNNTITGSASAIAGIQILTGYNYNGFNSTDVNATVSGNSITNAGQGLQITGSETPTQTANVKATGNLIQNNSANGITLFGFAAFNGGFNQNCIVGNAFGMLNNVPTITIDGTNNWWGDPSGPGPVGPGTGDAVSAAVTYSPFLTTPPISVSKCPALSATSTFTSTSSPTATNTPTGTVTNTATNTPTNTVTSTATNTPTGTLSSTPTVTSSITGTLSSTPTPTTTATATMTRTGTLIATASQATVPPVTNVNPTGKVNVADPQVSKVSDTGLAIPGQTVTFTLTVTNTGTAAATGVTVTDALPATLIYVSTSATQGTFAANANTVLFSVGTVNPGQVITLTVVTTVSTSVTPPADITNTAVLGYNGGSTSSSTTIHITAGRLPATGEPPVDSGLPGGWLVIVAGVAIAIGVIGRLVPRRTRVQ